MGHVRRVEVTHPSAAQVEHLSVGHRPRRTVGQVVHRHHAPDGGVGDLGARRRSQPFVHRPTLVGLDVAERDPQQALERHDARNCLGHEREELTRTAMEEQRLFRVDHELVEHEVGFGDIGRQPVDAVVDLVHGGFHQSGSSLVRGSVPLPRPEMVAVCVIDASVEA